MNMLNKSDGHQVKAFELKDRASNSSNSYLFANNVCLLTLCQGLSFGFFQCRLAIKSVFVNWLDIICGPKSAGQ